MTGNKNASNPGTAMPVTIPRHFREGKRWTRAGQRPVLAWIATLAAAPWPKKLADQIGAIRDLVTKAPAAWSVEQVAGAFKGASRADVEEVLDSLAALGILAGYEAGGGRRWKLTRATA